MKNNLHNMENLKYPIGKFSNPENISPQEIENWIQEIELFPKKLKTLTENLSAQRLHWIYRPDGWSIKQVVHHCADSHMNAFIRFKLALTEDLPTIKPYEEQLWATLADGLDDDISVSISIIEGLHHRWVLLLKSLNAMQLERQFIHPATQKMYTLESVMGMYAWHGNHHLAHIEQAIANEGNFNQ